MNEQTPRKTRCPECGGEPSAEDLARHKLSDIGYLHDDQTFECPDCAHRYTHGVPIDEFDGNAEDLWCDVCNLGYMRVHRVRGANEESVGLDLKCPHHHDFNCPHCGCHIPADGVLLTSAGVRVCPDCVEYIPKDEVPYCYYFDTTSREVDDRGVSLVGFPEITGQLNPNKEYGFHGSATSLYACPECTADDLEAEKQGNRTMVTCKSCGTTWEAGE